MKTTHDTPERISSILSPKVKRQFIKVQHGMTLLNDASLHVTESSLNIDI
jgi:hypothetical protein